MLLALPGPENGRAILAAPIVALTVRRRRIVDLEEQLEDFPVAHTLRIEDDLDGLGVAGGAALHLGPPDLRRLKLPLLQNPLFAGLTKADLFLVGSTLFALGVIDGLVTVLGFHDGGNDWRLATGFTGGIGIAICAHGLVECLNQRGAGR